MRSKTLAIAALVAALLVGSVTPTHAKGEAPGPSQQAAETAAQAARFAPFSGGWAKHGYSLNVRPDGTATAVWRTYQWCTDSGVTPPCDSIQDGLILGGGHARMLFHAVDGQTAFGTMLEHADIPPGWTRPVTLTLRPDGLAVLAWGDGASVLPADLHPGAGTVLCRPDAWQTRWCGA